MSGGSVWEEAGGLSLFRLQSQGWREKMDSKNVDSVRGLRDSTKDQAYGYLVAGTPENVA